MKILMPKNSWGTCTIAFRKFWDTGMYMYYVYFIHHCFVIIHKFGSVSYSKMLEKKDLI